jgi:hypothetical protein
MYIERMNSVPLQLVRYPSSSEALFSRFLCQTIRPSRTMVAVITVVSMRLQPSRGALHLHKLRGLRFWRAAMPVESDDLV